MYRNLLNQLKLGLFIPLLLLFNVFPSQAQITTADSLLYVIRADNQKELNKTVTLFLHELEKLPSARLEKKAFEIILVLQKSAAGEPVIFALQRIAQFYKDRNIPAEAIRFYQLAYEKAEKSGSQVQMGISLGEMATVYRKQEMLTESLQYIYQALKIFEQNKLYDKVVMTLYEASLINFRAANYPDAIKDFTAATDFYKKISTDSIRDDLKFYMMSGWNTTALSFRQLKKYQESLHAFIEADKIAHDLKNVFWMGLIDGNKGETYIEMGRYDEALAGILEDMHVSIQFKEYQSGARAACSIAEIYLVKKNPDKARLYLDTATMLFNTFGKSQKSELRYLLTYSKYYAAIGDYKKAYAATEKYKIVNDSLRDEEKMISLSQVKARYELEKNQSEIKLLSQANQLQQEELKNQKFLVLAAAFFILLILLFLIYIIANYRRLQKQNEIIAIQHSEIEYKNSELEAQSQQLQEQNQMIQLNNAELEIRIQEHTEQLVETNKELDTFLYHASHDIRRPIATLLGLEQISRMSDTDPKTKYLFDYVANTARDMDSMLYKLQMAYQLNQPFNDYAWISLHWVINEAAKRFDSEFYRLRIDYIHVQNNLVSSFASPLLLMIIFQNLIENAVNFKKDVEGGKSWIRVTSRQSEQNAIVTIEDNGIGIEDKYVNRIFDLYFRGTEKSKGNGLGLYLVKKAVKMLGGRIAVTSSFELGSTFTITLPLK